MKYFFATIVFLAMCLMASQGVNVLEESAKLLLYFCAIFIIYSSLVWIWFGNPFKRDK